MLASQLGQLLPPLTLDESLQVATINSVSDGFDLDNWGRRPFRAPHHTASGVSLVGGGSPLGPGEISKAHRGVLFLDELPEFHRSVLEMIREPLEAGRIVITRARQQATFPARFQLVAAMNPCPCGYFGDQRNRCECSIDQVERYRSKISGPLLDRIDLHVDVPVLPAAALHTSNPPGSHELMLRQIQRARKLMLNRQQALNAHLGNRRIEEVCALQTPDARLLDKAMDTLGLSARVYFKILKVARTIADLANTEQIETDHLTEALGFRQLDRYVPHR
jgi:magnesium chelatase family protein